MRSRYRGIDYYAVAARKCQEKYIKSLLHVPRLPNTLEDGDVQGYWFLKYFIADWMFSGNSATHVSLETSVKINEICGPEVKKIFLSSVLPSKKSIPCAYKSQSTNSENGFLHEGSAGSDAKRKNESNNDLLEDYVEELQSENENTTFEIVISTENSIYKCTPRLESMVVEWPEQVAGLQLFILHQHSVKKSFKDDELQLLVLKEKFGMDPGKVQPSLPSQYVAVGEIHDSVKAKNTAKDKLSSAIQNAAKLPVCHAPLEEPEKEIACMTKVSEKKSSSLFFFEASEIWEDHEVLFLVESSPLFPVRPTSLLQRSEMQLYPCLENAISTFMTIDLSRTLLKKFTLEHDQEDCEVFSSKSSYFEVLLILLKSEDYEGSNGHFLPMESRDQSSDIYDLFKNLNTSAHERLIFEVLSMFEESIWCTKGWEVVIGPTNLGPVTLDVYEKQAPTQGFEMLIVRPQLTLDSTMFQMLLVPVFSDNKKEYDLQSLIFESLFVGCKHFVLPASDWLYLDWHLSEGRDCNNLTCFDLRKKLREREEEQWKHVQVFFETGTEFLVHDELELLNEQDFVYSSGMLNVSHDLKSSNEVKEFDPSENLAGTSCKTGTHAGMLYQDEQYIRVKDKSKLSREDRLMNSTMSNDLTFFMQARKGSSRKNLLVECNENTSLKENNQTTERNSTLHIHKVELSTEIGEILQQIGADYTTLLTKEDKILIHLDLKVPEKISIESTGHTVLMSVITTEALKCKTEKRQQLLKVLIALYVLWQTALNLYHYGLRVAHLYLENLLHTLDFLNVWFCQSRSKLEEAFMRVESGFLEDHPKLGQLERVLKDCIARANKHEQQALKFCILGERRAFFTLYKTLSSLSLKPYEIDREETLLLHQVSNKDKMCEVVQLILDALSFSNCILVPPKYITSLFPIEKFTTFISYSKTSPMDEHGYAAEEILTTRNCELHLLQVKHSFYKQKKQSVLDVGAFDETEGGMITGTSLNSKASVDLQTSSKTGTQTVATKNVPYKMEDLLSQNISQQEVNRRVNDQMSGKRFLCAQSDCKTLPPHNIPERDIMSNVDTFGEHKSDTSRKTISLSGKNYKSPLWSLDSPQKPSSTEPQAYILRKRTAAEAFIQDNQQERSVSKLNKNFQKEEQNCACIIVANIVLSGGFILSARRSSYQNILNLEKRGIQVVERELRLPVDLILSAAVCLVLYTNEKFNFYTNSSYQGMTSLSPCLENIIDNHLKAISFSFKSCILIFEGPDEFTSRILANIDEVYAAAVGLNIRIQCFTSRDAAVTDTIVLGCIEAVQRSNAKKSFPLMTEARTLAEAFLTEFPSVNPLTAHAILCSGIPLPIFMSLTHDQQLTATKEFELPEHSMMLFNIQCQYGKTVCKARVSTDQNNPPMMKFEILQRSEEDPSVMHEWPIDDKGIAGGPKGSESPQYFDDYKKFSKNGHPYNSLDQSIHQLNYVPGLSPGSDVINEQFGREITSSAILGRSIPLVEKSARIANLLNDKIDGRHASPQQQQSAVRTSFLEDCEREPGETQKWKLGYPDIYTYQRELDPSYSEFRASPPYFPPTKDMDFDINLPWEDQPLHMKYQLSGQVSEHSIVTAMEDNNILGRQPMYSFKSGCNEGEDVQLGSVQAVLKDWLHTREKTREISLIGNRRQAYKFPDAGHHKLKHPLPGSSTMSKRFQEQATPRKTNNLKTPQTSSRKHFKKLDHSVWKNYSFKPTSSIDSLNKNKWTRSSLSTPSPKVPDFQILSAIKTPDDKKASQSLTYQKIGTDKQSRLIWSDIRSTKI